MRIGALTVIENGRVNLLEHFLSHYRQWCAPGDIHILVQCDTPEENASDMEEVCKFFRANMRRWDGPYSTDDVKKISRKLTKEIFDWEGWHFNVDSDEFFDPRCDVSAMCEWADRHKKAFFRAYMLDMAAEEGFPEIGNLEDIFGQFPVECAFTEHIVKGYPIKDCLLKNPLYGHHNAEGCNLTTQRAPGLYKLHHFKWDAGAVDRLRKRVENRGRYPWWRNSRHMLEAIEASGGSIDPTLFPPKPKKFDTFPE